MGSSLALPGIDLNREQPKQVGQNFLYVKDVHQRLHLPWLKVSHPT